MDAAWVGLLGAVIAAVIAAAAALVVERRRAAAEARKAEEEREAEVRKTSEDRREERLRAASHVRVAATGWIFYLRNVCEDVSAERPLRLADFDEQASAHRGPHSEPQRSSIAGTTSARSFTNG